MRKTQNCKMQLALISIKIYKYTINMKTDSTTITNREARVRFLIEKFKLLGYCIWSFKTIIFSIYNVYLTHFN